MPQEKLAIELADRLIVMRKDRPASMQDAARVINICTEPICLADGPLSPNPQAAHQINGNALDRNDRHLYESVLFFPQEKSV
jgi:hypothetical protein